MAVNSIGSLIHVPFFYWSAIVYCGFSQLNILNDLLILKKGTKLVDLPYKAIGELYLKVSVVALGLFSLKAGFKKLA